MKWEYKTVQYNRRSFITGRVDPEELNKKLNVQGKEGWELVNVENMSGWGMPGVIAVFKRQLQFRPKDLLSRGKLCFQPSKLVKDRAVYTFNLTEPQLYSLLSMVLFDFIFPSRNRKNLLGHLLVDLGNQRPLPESLERAEDKCREALEAREARERQDAERAYTRNDRGPLQPPYWARQYSVVGTQHSGPVLADQAQF